MVRRPLANCQTIVLSELSFRLSEYITLLRDQCLSITGSRSLSVILTLRNGQAVPPQTVDSTQFILALKSTYSIGHPLGTRMDATIFFAFPRCRIVLKSLWRHDERCTITGNPFNQWRRTRPDTTQDLVSRTNPIIDV